MNELILSLFPGIGLLDRAFEEEGFCIVRGPDVLWGGDVRRFHPPAGKVAGIIGGPPCQAFSQLRYMVLHNGYPLAENLIPEYERVVREAQPDWFLMENVPAAPEPFIAGYGITATLLNNRWVGGTQNRERRFSFGVRGGRLINLASYLEVELLEPVAWANTVTSSARQVPIKQNANHKPKTGLHNGRRLSIADMCELQGLPPAFLEDAPFSEEGKRKVLGNGVPLPMGRAIAAAVRRALSQQEQAA